VAVILWLWLGCSGSVETGDSAGAESEVVFVAETGAGRLAWYDEQGEVIGEQCFSELFETCAEAVCHVFGGLTPDAAAGVTYTRAEAQATLGGVLWFEGGRPPTLATALETLSFDTWFDGGFEDCDQPPTPPECRLRMPHDVVVHGDRVVVADTGNDRVLLLEVSGEVRAVLDADHPQWDGCGWPNHLQSLDEGLLVTCKASSAGLDNNDQGYLALWSLEDPEDPQRLWRWPEEGVLAAPHDGHVEDDLLVWAHSRGAGGLEDSDPSGSIGFARYRGAESPEYLGDGVVEDLGFVRSVELAPNGAILINDTGCELRGETCDQAAKVLWSRLPDLESPAGNGSWSEDHAEQAFLELEVVEPAFLEDLREVFEARVWEAGEVPVRGVCP